ERESSLQEVPCAVYSPAEAEVVDRIVALTHGKGQKAGRTAWSSVARARHNRDTARASEPGLDILEAYLKSGPNLSSEEKARWGGQYPLTVLDEALKQLAPRLGFKTAAELAHAYPKKLKAADRKQLECLMHDIGIERLGFPELRTEGTL